MNLLDTLIGLFTANGYLAVFLVLLACGFGIPIPEDITLVAGGVIAGVGKADVRLMCLVGLGGVLGGDATMFLIGRHFGDRALRIRWIRWLLSPRRYARVEAMYQRHGNRLMFFARFLPGLRTPIYLTAGMTRRVPFWRFLLLDGFAALISVPIWVYLGYFGAENHEWLLMWLKRGEVIALLAIVAMTVLVAIYFGRRQARHRMLQSLRNARRRHRKPPRL